MIEISTHTNSQENEYPIFEIAKFLRRLRKDMQPSSDFKIEIIETLPINYQNIVSLFQS